MLLATLNVFSTLIGASVGASVTEASVGASVACGPAGAAVGAAVPHAVRITSATEMKIIKGLRFDSYISSSSGKVVWELLMLIKSLDRQKERTWKRY
jgi:ABC-type cobalamin transport system permease subunit